MQEVIIHRIGFPKGELKRLQAKARELSEKSDSKVSLSKILRERLNMAIEAETKPRRKIAKEYTSFPVPDKMLRKLSKIAKKRRMRLSDYMRQAIEEFDDVPLNVLVKSAKSSAKTKTKKPAKKKSVKAKKKPAKAKKTTTKRVVKNKKKQVRPKVKAPAQQQATLIASENASQQAALAQ